MNDFYWGMAITLLAMIFMVYASHLTIFSPAKWRKYKREERQRVFEELKEKMLYILEIDPEIVKEEMEDMTYKEAKKRNKTISKSLKKYKL